MTLWAALWWQRNNLDGYTEHLLREDLLPKLFRTRHQCRNWIKEKYGYIKDRHDLRSEPHGWRLPRPVKVIIKRSDSGAQDVHRSQGKAEFGETETEWLKP